MKSSETQVNKKSQARGQTGLSVLLVNASSRFQDSVTRHLTEKLVEELQQHHGIAELTVRDVAALPLPFIDESWVAANFTAPENRDRQQQGVLAQSDSLVAELEAADVIILGVPIYNFSVPAALKAWIDMVARAGLTFRYTSEGPVGLLEGKQAFVVVASGGVPIDSAVDFATPYIRHVLGFIGIQDVSIIAAERLNVDNEVSQKTAKQQITAAVSSFSQQQTDAA